MAKLDYRNPRISASGTWRCAQSTPNVPCTFRCRRWAKQRYALASRETSRRRNVSVDGDGIRRTAAHVTRHASLLADRARPVCRVCRPGRATLVSQRWCVPAHIGV